MPRLGGNFGAGPYTFYQIVQTPTHLAFISEAFHDARVIPIGDRPHLPEDIRQWNGDSRGRWEGDTLVVETTNFSPKSHYRGAADGLHLVERFTRTGPDTLAYRVTLTDPGTWASSWTAEVPLQRREQPIYEFACHEGNYSIVGCCALPAWRTPTAESVEVANGRKQLLAAMSDGRLCQPSRSGRGPDSYVDGAVARLSGCSRDPRSNPERCACE